MTKLSTSQLEEILNLSLEKTLKNEVYDNFFYAPYEYSLLPAGKLFRPKLVFAICSDLLNNFDENHKLLASFVEKHHTYTLIHDDMPCMDNDEYRRGRLTTHKKFGQWQALLSGDGLLNASYGTLSRLKTQNIGLVFRYCTWALGPKGLILGQALDLSGLMNESFENLLLTHKLKTARLIQVCLVAPILAQDKKLKSSDIKLAKDLHRVGHDIGVTFQLLDDLTELVDEKLSEHENDVNPWPKNFNLCLNAVENSSQNIDSFFKKYNSSQLKEIYINYLEKISSTIIEKQSTIEIHVKNSLNPVVSCLNSFSLR